MKKISIIISLAILCVFVIKNNVYGGINSSQNRLVIEQYSKGIVNGSQPYKSYYGSNKKYDNYSPHSEIKVYAPDNSDVVVLVRYDNKNGGVAGHLYVCAGSVGKICLTNGFTYQTFFYFGTDWDREKPMPNGIKGGFMRDEAFSKDGNPVYLKDNILTYELSVSYDGNFNTSRSSEEEFF